jgi:hypothetical protein
MKRLIRKAYDWEANETNRRTIEMWLKDNGWQLLEDDISEWKNNNYPKIDHIDTTDINISIYFILDPEITPKPTDDINRSSATRYVAHTLTGLQNLLALVK